jgi:hypothetical protein
MSVGFGVGPLASGLLAQWAPLPTVLPYALHAVVLGAIIVAARGVVDTVEPAAGPRAPLLRIELDRAGWRAFWRGVAPMAPFVFAFPTIGFAALPAMLGGGLGSAPIAYTGLLCALILAAGVLAQPITRRFEPTRAARLGLACGALGMAVGGVAVATHTPALLLVVAPIVGTAYGVCMTAGLQAVQRLARPDARGGITGLYYVLTYLGFAAPYLLALATRVVAPTVAIAITAGLIVVAAIVLRRD